MQTRKIGSLSVSAIGLGCMNVSFGYGPCDEATGERLFNEALDAGYTFLDTAFMYGGGHNETLLGKALSARRKEFVLATKCGLSPDGVNGRPEKIKSECDITGGNIFFHETDLLGSGNRNCGVICLHQ